MLDCGIVLDLDLVISEEFATFGSESFSYFCHCLFTESFDR
jgi:hypothetical protein